ncbi:MAG TPA: hypothetical protein VD794_05855 [Flavisolibacter sp.]|nr:hypothetical protein [Flavisolibacter sp.]
MEALQINRVEDCMSWLQTGEAFTHSQSVNYLIDKMGELSVSLAFINNQMAIAKRLLNQKKVHAYNSLLASSVANETYFAPSLAKDYISAKCDKEQYDYDLCERCSRSIVHTVDAIRTAISALKMEKEYA